MVINPGTTLLLELLFALVVAVLFMLGEDIAAAAIATVTLSVDG